MAAIWKTMTIDKFVLCMSVNEMVMILMACARDTQVWVSSSDSVSVPTPTA